MPKKKQRSSNEKNFLQLLERKENRKRLKRQRRED
jgi:hypothetical protein